MLWGLFYLYVIFTVLCFRLMRRKANFRDGYNGMTRFDCLFCLSVGWFMIFLFWIEMFIWHRKTLHKNFWSKEVVKCK